MSFPLSYILTITNFTVAVRLNVNVDVIVQLLMRFFFMKKSMDYLCHGKYNLMKMTYEGK